VGVSILLRDESELIASDDVRVSLLTEQGSTLNCTYSDGSTVLPVFSMGGRGQALAGFRYSIRRDAEVRVLRLELEGRFYDLDLGNDLTRTDLGTPILPPGLGINGATE
jgi:hypothetical protein